MKVLLLLANFYLHNVVLYCDAFQGNVMLLLGILMRSVSQV